MVYMTNPMLPTNPATYCGSSHHTTRNASDNVGRVNVRALPLGATVGGVMWSLTLGTICHPRKRIFATQPHGVHVVKRTAAGVHPAIYTPGGHYREERMS